jgi:hypothetical protein
MRLSVANAGACIEGSVEGDSWLLVLPFALGACQHFTAQGLRVFILYFAF